MPASQWSSGDSSCHTLWPGRAPLAHVMCGGDLCQAADAVSPLAPLPGARVGVQKCIKMAVPMTLPLMPSPSTTVSCIHVCVHVQEAGTGHTVPWHCPWSWLLRVRTPRLEVPPQYRPCHEALRPEFVKDASGKRANQHQDFCVRARGPGCFTASLASGTFTQEIPAQEESMCSLPQS